MKLYNSIGPNPRMVRMFMAEKGIEIPKVEVDLLAGENRKEPYLGVNAAGQMPALELDDGTVVAEITAICEYLDDVNKGTPSLIGTTPQERAVTHMWVRRVDLNTRGWDNGVEVWPQVTSRPVTVEFSMGHGGLLTANTEFRALMGSSLEARRAAYRDPAWRERAIEAFAQQRALRPRWDTYVITRCTAEPALVQPRTRPSRHSCSPDQGRAGFAHGVGRARPPTSRPVQPAQLTGRAISALHK